jgi:hypothetical protein
MNQEREQLLNNISRNTIAFRIKAWVDNFLANQSRIAGGYGIASMTGALLNVPCIIVGSGPTLDRNIKQLHGLENRACIISCDSATKALLEHGVTPHIVLITDSKKRVGNFFDGVDTSKLNFVVDTFVHPDTVDMLEGRVYWYNTLPVEACAFTGALNEWTGFIGSLGTGGCVATSIWFFAAAVLGCDPDILVGLPEAFYDPAEMYAQAVTRTVKTEPYDTKPVESVDIFGKLVYTYPALQSFAFWFQEQFLNMPRIHINCSEGGILKENILNMPLAVCADRYLTTEYDIEALLFAKESAADVVIKNTSMDISQHRALLTALLDGPSVPNLARKMGMEPMALVEAVSQLRNEGLNIQEGINDVPQPDGTVERVTTFILMPPEASGEIVTTTAHDGLPIHVATKTTEEQPDEKTDAGRKAREDDLKLVGEALITDDNENPGCDMRPEEQQGAPGEEPAADTEQADDSVEYTGVTASPTSDTKFSID